MTKQLLIGLFICAAMFNGPAHAGPLSLKTATIAGTYSAGVLVGPDYMTNTAAVTEDALSPEFFSEETLPGGSSLYYVDFDYSGLVGFFTNVDYTLPTSPANTAVMTFVFSGLTEKISSFALKDKGTVSGADKAVLKVISNNSVSIDLSQVSGWVGYTEEPSGFTTQLTFAPLATTVPEPGSISLLAIALIGMAAVRRRA